MLKVNSKRHEATDGRYKSPGIHLGAVERAVFRKIYPRCSDEKVEPGDAASHGILTSGVTSVSRNKRSPLPNVYIAQPGAVKVAATHSYDSPPPLPYPAIPSLLSPRQAAFIFWGSVEYMHLHARIY